ncbi:DUF2142 domain-containing protein [Hyphobacterium sp. HN65]|uniref:DUF2142 domain-containing protein n=1 Tax=Hyphobacterium lacteum TaxID=3116575 RepID=A0ABU7LSI8_9PROT|nr:DUF2142 domain-containing protein [Hyphobacterium sp. HN65]MEE2526866.1 DUF2142 domain-containing protein [Hyphobacterium sp. HN65]
MIQSLFQIVRLLTIVVRRYPQRVFLAYALPSILAFSMLTPPLFAPDETAHVMRAYSVSALRLLPSGMLSEGQDMQPVPADYVAIIDTYYSQLASDGYFGWQTAIDHPTASWRSAEIGFLHNAEGYFPLFYIPQAIVIRLAWVFDVSIIDTLRYGRLLLGCLFVYLGYLALSLARWGRLGLLLLVSLPISVFLGASFSPDAWLIASSSLAFAMMTRTGPSHKSSSERQMAAWIIIAATALRPSYLLMNAIWVRSTFREIGKKPSLLLIAGFIIATVWAFLVVAHPDRRIDGINPELQFAFLLSNPLAVFEVAWTTLSNHAALPLRQIFIVTNHPNAHASDQLALLLSAVTILVIFTDYRRVAVKEAWTWILIGCAVLSYGLIYGAMYLGWTAVGSMGPVQGVQGRYFVPLLVFALLALPSISASRIALRITPVISICLVSYFLILNYWTINQYFNPEI